MLHLPSTQSENEQMRAVLVISFVLGILSSSAIASPSLPVITIAVDTSAGRKAFSVEVASDARSQQRGLMFRRKMAPDAGMLFDFHDSLMLTFWMKNTFLPLDMLFIRTDGTISTIAPNAVPLTTTPIPSAEPVRAVLEINGGRAQQLGIHAGDRVRAAIFHNLN
jgi:uncharacterized protein